MEKHSDLVNEYKLFDNGNLYVRLEIPGKGLYLQQKVHQELKMRYFTGTPGKTHYYVPIE